MSEPSPDLYDICVVLNEVGEARLGSNLIPYAERVKAIVIKRLIMNIEYEHTRLRALDPFSPTNLDAFADWLRAQGGQE